MSRDEQLDPFGDGSLEKTLGDTARIRLLRYLAGVEEPTEQAKIAETIGVSESMISRAKRPFVEQDLVLETNEGLVASRSLRDAVNAFQELIDDEYYG